MKYKTQKLNFFTNNNPNYKTGKYCKNKQYYCKICNSKIGQLCGILRSRLCKSCAQKGKIMQKNKTKNV